MRSSVVFCWSCRGCPMEPLKKQAAPEDGWLAESGNG
jgi:hypothetical protein